MFSSDASIVIMSAVYEEVDLDDMTYDAEQQAYSYPCPCGDKFIIALEELYDGEDIAPCPSCTLRIRVVFEQDKLPALTAHSDDEDGDGCDEGDGLVGATATAAANEEEPNQKLQLRELTVFENKLEPRMAQQEAAALLLVDAREANDLHGTTVMTVTVVAGEGEGEGEGVCVGRDADDVAAALTVPVPVPMPVPSAMEEKRSTCNALEALSLKDDGAEGDEATSCA